MNVGQLKKLLEQYPDDYAAVVPDGEGFRKLVDGWPFQYRPSTEVGSRLGSGRVLRKDQINQGNAIVLYLDYLPKELRNGLGRRRTVM